MDASVRLHRRARHGAQRAQHAAVNEWRRLTTTVLQGGRRADEHGATHGGLRQDSAVEVSVSLGEYSFPWTSGLESVSDNCYSLIE
jgi:hypothetical protein